MVTALAPEDLEAARAYHRQREERRASEREARRTERLAAARRALAELAPEEPSLRAVYLYGSILQPGKFGERSDLDVAVDSDDPAAESRLWRALEDTLDLPVDLRPLAGKIAKIVERGGECVYARRPGRP